MANDTESTTRGKMIVNAVKAAEKYADKHYHDLLVHGSLTAAFISGIEYEQSRKGKKRNPPHD